MKRAPGFSWSSVQKNKTDEPAAVQFSPRQRARLGVREKRKGSMGRLCGWGMRQGGTHSVKRVTGSPTVP